MSSRILPRSLATLVTGAVALLAQSISASEPEVRLEPGTLLSWTTTAGNSYQPRRSVDGGGSWSDAAASVSGAGGGVALFLAGRAPSTTFQVVESYPVALPPVAILQEGGFEGTTGWTVGGGQPPTRVSTTPHSGSFAMRCALLNVGSAPAEGLLSQTQLPVGSSVTPGSAYVFSFWAKQVSVGPSYVQQYWLQWLNSSGGIIGGTGLQNFSGTIGSWVKITAGTQTAPAGTTGVKVLFRLVTGAVAGGYGEVLIDDVELASATGASGGTSWQTRVIDSTPQSALRLSWTGASGFRYTPESSTDLVTWTPTGTAQLGTGAVLTATIAQAQPTEFHRVAIEALEPPPPNTSGYDPLFTAATVLEPESQYQTPTALVTTLADRARDRHAREAIYNSYDHYLTFYWEQRIANVEIVDEVAKGGTKLIFNYTTQAPLNPAEFRAFFRGQTTVAEYHYNVQATFVGSHASLRYPGETDYDYTVTLETKLPENRALQVGDRVEIEISQFLGSVRNGRLNYYGTTLLYIIGQGIVPWYQENEYVPGGSIDSRPLPTLAWLGGLTTLPYQYSNEPEHRFKQTAGNIAPISGAPFMLGRRLHHTEFDTGAHTEPGNPVFAAQVGKLGPKFVARSCVECHVNNGRSLPPAVGQTLRLSVVKTAADSAGTPDPVVGEELQSFATSGAGEGSVTLTGYTSIPGTYGDGTDYTLRKPTYSFSGYQPAVVSVRVAPQLVGLGLLEAIPEESLAALADPADANGDGISGRLQLVEDPEDATKTRIGRFTYKGSQAKVAHQIAYALNRDMSVATPTFPVLDGETAPSAVEVSSAELEQMNRYVALLGVAARRNLTNPVALRGETVFQAASCVACHTPSFTTSARHPYAELRSQTIRPYTDLLLHDLGPGLADSLSEGQATGSEWRTAPLWNIGLTNGVSGGEAYLHDGRARTLEEAILWHGGEAEASKEAFRNLPAADRTALVEFLKSL